ncbi:MAG: aldo/keto reductase [Candidatus Scalindua sp.]|jgi:aryl-alcohol dehydrogenase-like predicted oxidoreductase|nr:aldo/keto reductase [Candidatus Scalindua sp.]MBT6229430.1 aldo/keto reductase [Candidatus Scalindua sp.]MBT6563730.1 aldo/keto reductase [Candidatus Scalindua sp.]
MTLKAQMHDPSSRLVLGTAQLGAPYGIANKTGQPDTAAARSIVKNAWESGIREFDTAQSYGEGERVLGSALVELGISREAKVITKFDPNLQHLDKSAMYRALDTSLKHLRVPRLYGVLLHCEAQLDLWEKGIGKILLGFVRNGQVERVGVSVYSTDKALRALETNGVEMVQVPSNLLDRRFLDAGIFELADKKGKCIYIRSVYLQGLILMSPDELPEKMEFARSTLEKLVSISQEFGMSRQEIALSYLKMVMPKAQIIFGAETPGQVKENVACWRKILPDSLINCLQKRFMSVDEKILNPVLWT